LTTGSRGSLETVKELLARAARNDSESQEAIERLYRHYDPLIHAALPKGLSPQDAEDLVMDTWATVVAELHRGRRLRNHGDVVALIEAQMQAVTACRETSSLHRQRRLRVWSGLKRFISLLLPNRGE